MNNLSYCNFAKTVLMLSVVLCHSAAFYGGNWFSVCSLSQPNEVLGLLSSWLGTFHVEGFTLISGYIYYHIKFEKDGYRDFGKYIGNKFQRLLVPYIAVSIFWVIPIASIFYSYSLIEVVRKFLLGESPAQLWFLLMLFNVFVIYDSIVAKFNWGGQSLVVIVFFLAGVALGKFCPNVFQILTSMRYLLYFHIGCILRRKYPNLQAHSMLKYGVVFLVVNLSLFAIINIDIQLSDSMTKVINLIGKTFCDVSGAIMAFLLLSWLASKVYQQNKLSQTLITLSFPIYLFHQQIICILLWNFSTMVNPYIMCVINFLCSILVSYCMGKVLMKHKATRYLIGIK